MAASNASSTEHSELWQIVAANVQERVSEGDGFWRSCSGCYEMEDGQNVHGYPHSDVFGCILGSGCSECGGIGAVWDTTDYGAMADELHAEMQSGDVAQRPANPTLAGAISAVYGQLDAEDCKIIDREWARMRGYILPADGTSALAYGAQEEGYTTDPAIRSRDDFLASKGLFSEYVAFIKEWEAKELALAHSSTNSGDAA